MSEVSQSAERSEGAMNPSTETAYVLDEIVCKPGKAKEVIQAYNTLYVPAAKARGMELDRIIKYDDVICYRIIFILSNRLEVAVQI